MINYNQAAKLAPGVYLYAGGQVKAIANVDTLLGTAKLDAASLANSVSWSYIALRMRRVRLREFEHRWTLRGQERDDGLANWLVLVPRIDEAVQLFGRAYLYKIRDGARRISALKWLDPRTVTVPQNAVGDDGTIEYYERTVNGRLIKIPGDDVIEIIERGLPEVHPTQPAAEAARNVLQATYNLERVLEFVARNPTPVGLLVVPDGTPVEERGKLRAFFSFLLNPKSTDAVEQRIEPVTAGVEFRKISFDPGDLTDRDADILRAKAILAAYGVPSSEVLDSANYATAMVKRRQFLAELGGAAKLYAGIINADPDVSKLGWAINVYPEQHQDLQTDELEIAQAMAVYVKAGLTPQAAAWRLGIQADDFPPEIGEPFAPLAPVQAGSGVEPGQDVSGRTGTVVSARAALDLERWQRKSLNALKRGNAAAVEFESDDIPPALAGAIRGQLEQAETPADVRRVFVWAGYP